MTWKPKDPEFALAAMARIGDDSGIVVDQPLDLAFNPLEKRDEKGRWTIDPAHIVDRFHEATDGEKKAGRDWYPAAHRTALALSKKYGVSKEEAAGLLAAYSPQTPWGRNQVEASETLRYGHGIGGPKAAVWFSRQPLDQPNTLESRAGVMATGNTKSLAERLLHGENFDAASAGVNKNGTIKPKALKIRSFYHLIAQGGQSDPENPYVVIDRHAMSVAFGQRVTQEDYDKMHPASGAQYKPFVAAYVEAAKRISKEEGRTVTPEEVQATTWLVQQRLNQAEQTRVGKTRKALGEKDWNEWTQYAARYLGLDTETGAQVGYSELSCALTTEILDLANPSLERTRRVTKQLLDGEDPVTLLVRRGIDRDVADAARALASRGTVVRPNARRAGHPLTLPIRIERDREALYRGAYMLKAAERMQAAKDDGKSLRQALSQESRFYQMHEQARRGRLEAVTAAQRVAGEFGEKTDTPSGQRTLVGWYLDPLKANDEECKAANGHNFYAEEGTVIGYPGAVHLNCGCKAGPPIEGAGLVNDAVQGVVQLASVGKKPTFKLSRKKKTA